MSRSTELNNVVHTKYSTKIYINFISLGTLAAEIKAQHHKNVYPKGVKRVRTALDSLQSVDRKEREAHDMSSDLYSEADEILDMGNDGNCSDSSGNGTRFSKCTGVFSLDFPPSPKVSKGKGKKSRPIITEEREETDSDVTTVMPTQTQELTVTGHHLATSDSDVVIQPSGFITECKKRKRSTSRRHESATIVAKGVNCNATKKMKGTPYLPQLFKFNLSYPHLK